MRDARSRGRRRTNQATAVAAGLLIGASALVALPDAGAQGGWTGFDAVAAPLSAEGAAPAWGAAVLPSGNGYEIWSNNHHFISGVITNPGGTPGWRSTGIERWDTHGVSAFDADTDGDLDIVELTGAEQGLGESPHRVFLNNGNNTFTLDPSSGIESPLDRGRGPVPFDADADGDIDLLVTNLNLPADASDEDKEAAASKLFLNDGNGNFTRADDPNAVIPAYLNLGNVSALSPGGESYLFAVNSAIDTGITGWSRTELEANPSGVVTNANVTNRVAVSDIRDAVMGDFDGDLRPEVVVARARFATEPREGPGFTRLALSPGRYATLIDVNGTSSAAVDGAIPQVNATDNCWAASAADWDNDRDLDVLLACSHPALPGGEGIDPTPARTTNTLLLNDGSGNFTVSINLPAAPQQVMEFGLTVEDPSTATGRLVVSGDWDGDGYIDAFIGYGHDSETARDQLLLNRGGSNHWVALDLDPSDHTFGIGAQVFVGSASGWQGRQVGHAQHLTQDALTQHVGLGSDDAVYETLVVWPDGSIERFEGVAADSRQTLTQGAGTALSQANLTAELAAAPNAPDPDPEPQPGTVADASSIEEIRAATDYQASDADTLRLYRAFFNREPDVEGVKYWIAQTRAGLTMDDLAFNFSNSAEFALYGDLDDAQFLDLLYRNILGRDPDQAGFDYWLGEMNSGLLRHLVVRWIVANDEFIINYPYSPL